MIQQLTGCGENDIGVKERKESRMKLDVFFLLALAKQRVETLAQGGSTWGEINMNFEGRGIARTCFGIGGLGCI